MKDDHIIFTCAKHKSKQAVRVCISDGCNIGCMACQSCLAQHDHHELIFIKPSQVIDMANFGENKTDPSIKINVQSMQKQFRQIMSQIKSILEMSCTQIQSIADQIFNVQINTKQQKLELKDYIQKTGCQMKSLYTDYQNIQNSTVNQKLPSKLIYKMMQYGVLLKQVLPSFQQAIGMCGLFDFYARQTKFSSFSLKTEIEKLNKLFQFKQGKTTPAYEKTLRQFKQLNTDQKYDQVIAKINDQLLLYPTLPLLYFERAFAEFDKGLYKKAFVSYRICNDLKGPSYITNTNSGICLLKQAHFSAGIIYFQKAIQDDYKYANAYYNKGIAYQSIRKYEALIFYQRVLEYHDCDNNNFKDLQEKIREKTKEIIKLQNNNKIRLYNHNSFYPQCEQVQVESIRGTEQKPWSLLTTNQAPKQANQADTDWMKSHQLKVEKSTDGS